LRFKVTQTDFEFHIPCDFTFHLLVIKPGLDKENNSLKKSIHKNRILREQKTSADHLHFFLVRQQEKQRIRNFLFANQHLLRDNLTPSFRYATFIGLNFTPLIFLIL